MRNQKDLKVMNVREVKQLNKVIDEQWGCNLDVDFAFLIDSKNKVFLISRDLDMDDVSKLRMNKMGLYVGTYDLKGFRLSIEGSQLIGPKAKKNVLELEGEEVLEWLRGNDVEVVELREKEVKNVKNKKELTVKKDDDTKGKGLNSFLIIKTKNEITKKEDFLGCGKRKGDIILNFVSKNRKVNV